MTFDQWRTKSPEDERERLDRAAARRLAKFEWLEEHADDLNEERRERLMEPEPPDFDLY